MEILLAIVVVSAVIIFGALISIGNERQKKAIDVLTEKIVQWVLHDLKIKREHLVQTVQIPDPLGWLNRTASRVCGYDLKLETLEVFEDPQAISCTSADGSVRIIVSPLSISAIRKIKKSKHNRLLRFVGNPVLNLPKDVEIYEMSLFTIGYMADIELALVWRKLTNHELLFDGRIWIYFIHLRK